MAYSYRTTIKTPDDGTREIYIHAGKDVNEYVVDALGHRVAEDSSLIFGNWTDYVAFQSSYNNAWYRLYQEDKWTFRVEESPA
jgi:hypothetical protein